MKVLLKEDVDNLGYAGEVHKVANGFGRNYLLPRGLAVKATPGVLKQAESWRTRAEARRAELRAEHEALAEKIRGTRLVFIARAGENGKLYGSVTTNDVVDKLNETLGTDIDRRKVEGEPLRQLGEHQVTVRLSRDVQPQVTIDIHPESGVQEEDEVEPAAEAAADTEAEAAEEFDAAEEEAEVIDAEGDEVADVE